MRHVVTTSLFAVAVSFLALVGVARDVHADDGLICAAVHPCNPDGSVQAPFNTGACASKYAQECLSEKANAIIGSCEDSRESAEVRAEKLEKKLKRANRTIRRLRK